MTHSSFRSCVLKPLSIGVLFAACAPLWADSYRWVDQDGEVLFSQNPPENAAFERIEVPPPPELGTPNPAVRDALAEESMPCTASMRAYFDTNPYCDPEETP